MPLAKQTTYLLGSFSCILILPQNDLPSFLQFSCFSLLVQETCHLSHNLFCAENFQHTFKAVQYHMLAAFVFLWILLHSAVREKEPLY